ncbi:MAG: hypothetical protein ACRDHW_14670, partial [Ktedonobacteraceae bacterium]
MAFYQYSWTILFAPLLSFVLIIFGTRMWDLASRPRATVAVGGHGHDEIHSTDQDEHGHGDEHGGHGLDDDDDPKVAYLSMGA